MLNVMNSFHVRVAFSIFNLINVLTAETLDNNVIEKQPSVNEVAHELVEILGVKLENATDKRFQDLKEKLEKISAYVIDKDIYAELLHNETIDTNLTQINFYKALNESDHFRYLYVKDPKSLYLKLKEKMNRDDILKILSEKKESGLSMYARRMMNDEVQNEEDGAVDYEVDKYIAAKAEDDHQFKDKDIEQMYWDPQPELEERQTPTRRIYMGERSTIDRYPFMVSIHVMKRFWCGGTLYWQDIVLTTASCLQLMHNNRFFRENPRVLQVRVGSNHSRIGGEMIDALEVYFHPAYNPRTLSSNIAVIRLRYRITFTYHRVPKLLKISHSRQLVPYTSSILILGWGVIRTTSKMRFEPVFVTRKILPVYPNKFCQEVYGEKFVTQHMFCAGTMTTGEGACDHDAGGPAILNGKLVGLISFGPAICGFPDAPTVFTLVGAFSDWIETVNESMPSYYRNYAKTTFGTERTPDFRSVRNMFTPTTPEPQRNPITSSRVTAAPISGAGRHHRMFRQKYALVAAETSSGDTRTISVRPLPPWMPSPPRLVYTVTTESKKTTKTTKPTTTRIRTRPLPNWMQGQADLPLWPNGSDYDETPIATTRTSPRFAPGVQTQPKYAPFFMGDLFPKGFTLTRTTPFVAPNYGFSFTTQHNVNWYFTLRRGLKGHERIRHIEENRHHDTEDELQA